MQGFLVHDERFVEHHMKIVILGEFVLLPYGRKDVFVG